jgi:hypothetical protein
MTVKNARFFKNAHCCLLPWNTGDFEPVLHMKILNERALAVKGAAVIGPLHRAPFFCGSAIIGETHITTRRETTA